MAVDTSRVRALSSAIFGNEKVVEVVLAMDALSEPKSATAQDLNRATGIAHSMVRDVLVRLVDGELVTAVPKVGGSRSPQYYQPRDGWADLVDLARWAHATASRSTQAR